MSNPSDDATAFTAAAYLTTLLVLLELDANGEDLLFLSHKSTVPALTATGGKVFIKEKKLCGLFLWIGLNCLRATQPLRVDSLSN